MVGIVGATGAPEAVGVILGSLPVDFPAPIVVLIPMQLEFTNRYIAWHNARSTLPVVTAENEAIAEPGVVYMAPGFLGLRLHEGRLCLSHPGDYLKMMDIFFRSMATALGPKAIAVALTGMGSDGAQGMKDIRDAGGYTIAQDEATSVVYHKPRCAVELGAACELLPLSAIASRLNDLARSSNPLRTPDTH
jgi:two-component system chemotaxis response regulator CheB